MYITEILIDLTRYIIFSLISGLFLMVITKIRKLKNTSYKTAFIISVLVVILTQLLLRIPLGLDMIIHNYLILAIKSALIIISLLVGALLIKKFYMIKWKETWIVWSFWFVLVIGLYVIEGILIYTFLSFVESLK